MWFSKLFKKQKDLQVISIGQLDQTLNDLFKQLPVYKEFKKLQRDLESKKVLIDKYLKEINDEKTSTLLHAFFNNITIKTDYRQALKHLQELSQQVIHLQNDIRPIYYRHKKNKPTYQKLMQKIDELDSLVADKIYKVSSSDLKDYLQAKQYQIRYFECMEEKERLSKEIEKAFMRRTALLEKKTRYTQRKKELENKSRYQELETLKEQEETLKQEQQKQEQKVSSLIKYLHIPKKAKKQFQKQRDINILKPYTDDISNKRYKTIQEETNKLEDITEKIQNIQRRRRGHSLLLEVKEQKGWIQRVEKEIQNFDKDITRMQTKKEDLNPTYYLQELNKTLKKHDVKVIANEIN